MRVNSKIKPISLFLSGLFILIALNKAVYIHTHVCDNNRIIAHSHPYNKAGETDATKKHEHSRNVLVLIANFESLVLILLFHAVILQSSTTPFWFNYFPLQKYLFQVSRIASARAPPITALY